MIKIWSNFQFSSTDDMMKLGRHHSTVLFAKFSIESPKTQSVGYIDVLCCLQLLAVYLLMRTLRSYCDVRQVINRDTIVCTRNLDFRSISCCVTIYRLNFNIWRTYFAD